ncbi:hypothetical protein LOTGIDRAFT_174658 [Lottia gigantea]|uniref:Uncharacterized protein n=1 Tax=Lottia gigantea TaxID=225164 RepID=V4ATI3_LOTGI|nr:hypothetical protein LOTGIDRAFT_174658 [Lottia gigantea]ESO97051.1 hypothetical protein LOTGIDRAFT_174658 [Lottia gigantea]
MTWFKRCLRYETPFIFVSYEVNEDQCIEKCNEMSECMNRNNIPPSGFINISTFSITKLPKIRMISVGLTYGRPAQQLLWGPSYYLPLRFPSRQTRWETFQHFPPSIHHWVSSVVRQAAGSSKIRMIRLGLPYGRPAQQLLWGPCYFLPVVRQVNAGSSKIRMIRLGLPYGRPAQHLLWGPCYYLPVVRQDGRPSSTSRPVFTTGSLRSSDKVETGMEKERARGRIEDEASVPEEN